MRYSFNACGHENILAAHKTTLEFTKDRTVTKKGDCIIGVNSNFKLKKIRELIKNRKYIKTVIKINNKNFEIRAEINPNFNSDKEMVIRKTDFCSERTLAIRADKAAMDIPRDIVGMLRQPGQKTVITFYAKNGNFAKAKLSFLV